MVVGEEQVPASHQHRLNQPTPGAKAMISTIKVSTGIDGSAG
jgi:hypothetical protein